MTGRGTALWPALSLALLVATAGQVGADCTQCATGQIPATPDGIHPFFGMSQVAIYLDEELKSHDPNLINPKNVENAVALWSKCRGLSGFPEFEVRAEAAPGNRDVRTTIFIDYQPLDPTKPAGSTSHLLAEAQGTLITLLGVCSSPSGICDSQDRVVWNSAYGEQVIAHEIGHTLGLGHDKDKGCATDSLMKEVTSSSKPLGVSDEHCALAAAMNDPLQTCGLNASGASVHPCQQCQHEIGGTVDGIVIGERIHLQLTLPTTGGVYNWSGTQPGSFTFVELVPEGFQYEVTVADLSNPDKLCGVTNGSGTMGTSDVTDVEVLCECIPGSPSTARYSAAALTICDNPRPGETFELDIQTTADLCTVFPSLCGDGGGTFGWGDPWWWYRPGPPSGCSGETTCVSLGTKCEPLSDTSGDGKVDDEDDLTCYEELDCSQPCSAIGASTLAGPRLQLEGLDEGDVVSGPLVLTGFAEDRDGLAGLRVYLDGAPAATASFAVGTFRADACGGRSGDCDPFSGFEVVLNTSAWTDGPHRLDLVAVDGSADYPMPTTASRSFQVDNACAGSSAPQVQLDAPAPGEIVTGSVVVAATATAGAGVERVRFHLDGARVATDWTAPYSWTWDSTAGGDRGYTLQAEVLDRCGGSAWSAPVEVETANANPVPQVEVEIPVGGATLQGGAVEVSGWAVDGDGIADLEVRLDGLPISSATAWVRRSRPEICDALGAGQAPDPACPEVGFALAFDSTLHADGWHQLQVLVLDGRGGQRSRSRSVRIANQPPSPPAVTDPLSGQVLVGDDVSFQVSASGEGPLSYRWQYRLLDRWIDLHDGDRGGRVSGAATPTLALASAALSDAGGYRCRVGNPGGTTASPSASLSVLESVDAPTVTAGIDRTVTEGERAELRVTAEGYPPLSYRWQQWTGTAWVDLVNGGPVSGATAPTLTLDPVDLSHGGQYRCRVTNPGGTTPSDPVRLTVSPDLSGSCVAGPDVVCLHGQRFAAEVVIDGGAGKAAPYSDLAGMFTLANPDNVEVSVKVLDGRTVNGRFWVFHGSLTSRSYTVTVTDTVTGVARSYFKPSGSFCGGSDTTAFQDPEATGSSLVGRIVLLPANVSGGATAGNCTGSLTELCLLDSRFRVEVFKDGSARRAVGVSPLTGAFTFGSTANPEVVVKVLDGTPVNDWYWVFFGSLTSQDYEVRVTDTAGGATKAYPAPGPSCGTADTEAF